MKKRPPSHSHVDNQPSSRIVMVGAAIPDDLMAAVMKVDARPQVQTHKLSWAIINGMEHHGVVVDLISTTAISDYPHTKWLLSPYRRWNRSNGSDNRVVPFINIFGIKHLTRFLSCMLFLFRWCVKNRGKGRRVLVYGLLSPHLFAVRLLAMFFPLKMAVLITDIPGQAIQNESPGHRVLRQMDARLIRWAVRACDRQFVLARRIAEDYFPTVPALVVEGIVSTESESMARATVSDAGRSHSASAADADFVIMYAGQLQRQYGIPMLLEALALMPDTPCQIWLAGHGDMEADIRVCAKQDSRLIYLGSIVPSEVFRLSCRATVLINTRSSHEVFAPYSFPSKTLEYMATGRPVISTRLPGIPDEYAPYLIWLHDETAQGLANLLRQLFQTPRVKLDEVGRKAQRFVLENKTASVQGQKMLEFMR